MTVKLLVYNPNIQDDMALQNFMLSVNTSQMAIKHNTSEIRIWKKNNFSMVAILTTEASLWTKFLHVAEPSIRSWQRYPFPIIISRGFITVISSCGN
jgi:hypothetical protein